MPHAEAWLQVQKQFAIADDLVLEFLDNLEEDLWFRMPGEGVTHIAWQVGHLTVSNYGLGLAYARGPKEGDADLVSEGFRELFGRGSQPSPDVSIYPTAEALDQAYRAVSQEIRVEAPGYELAALDTPLDQPRPMFKTRFEALNFLPQHIMLHLGQMSLLRRLAGKPARR